MGFRTVRLNEATLGHSFYYSALSKRYCVLGADARQNFDWRPIHTSIGPCDMRCVGDGWLPLVSIATLNDAFVFYPTPENRAALEQACLENRIRILWETGEEKGKEDGTEAVETERENADLAYVDRS